MTSAGPPGPPVLGHDDPAAVALGAVIRTGDLAGVRQLLAERPGIASARMVGPHGVGGGWRTPLHVAADWPGYFPAGADPAAVPDHADRPALAAAAGPDTRRDLLVAWLSDHLGRRSM